MNEEDKDIQGVKNQDDMRDVVCGYIANNIATILNKRGVISEEQMEQIIRKNGELFTRKK